MESKIKQILWIDNLTLHSFQAAEVKIPVTTDSSQRFLKTPLYLNIHTLHSLFGIPNSSWDVLYDLKDTA